MEKKIVAVSFPEIKLAHAKSQVPEAVIIVTNLLLADSYEYNWGVIITEDELLERLNKFVHSSESFGVDIDPDLIVAITAEDFKITYLDSIFKHFKYIYETEGQWKTVELIYSLRASFTSPERSIRFSNE